MKRPRTRFLCAASVLLILVTSSRPASAQTRVLTRSYNNARTGANTTERVLTPERIARQGLTKIFSLKLVGDDPRIEAQPLYLPNTLMSDGKRHDVIFVFSMSNRVGAFDANSGRAIWRRPVSLGPPFIAKVGDEVDPKRINVSFGILSTPVIDANSGTIYVVYWLSDKQTHQTRRLKLSALNVADGKPKQGKAKALDITATYINPATHQTIFLQQEQKQRAALLLTQSKSAPGSSMLYVALTGAEDPPVEGDLHANPRHGWIVAFDVDRWKKASQWVSTPSSFGGGIWQGSQGPAADEAGNVYAMTANGGYTVGQGGDISGGKDYNGTTDFAESFVKLAMVDGPHGPALTLVDWFIPFRDSVRRSWSDEQAAPFPAGYYYTDQDLGSAGPILPPGTGLVLGAGKDGVLYVMDRSKMGKSVGDFSKLKAPPSFFTYDPDQSVAAYAEASASGNLDFKPMQGVKTHHLHGSPVYWKSRAHGPMLFAWGENESLRAYSLDKDGRTRQLAHGNEVASADIADPRVASLGGMSGGMLTLSANGAKNGILWATIPAWGDANTNVVPGIVLAYDASKFDEAATPDGIPRLRTLWQSSGFSFSKFCPPVVADEKLIVPTYDGKVDVYALTLKSARMRN